MMKSAGKTFENRKFAASNTNISGRAVVLLEVVLALSIFASTVAVVWSAMSNSQLSSKKMEIRSRLNDLAISRVSEIHSGIISIEEVEYETYEDVLLEDYSWSLSVTAMDNLDEYTRDEKLVVVTISHNPTGLSRKLAELMIISEDGS